jgi:hypothetical protein
MHMKKFIPVLLLVPFLVILSPGLFAQTNNDKLEFGIATGGFTNFPANQDYLKKGMSVIYLSPYILTGKHEFSLGFAYSLPVDALAYNDGKIDPRPGFVAGYKFYVFDVYGRENMFIHYSFEYLGFKGHWETNAGASSFPDVWNEKDIYINNVIGLGYNLYFDQNERFGLYYILDYLISQAGYKTSGHEDFEKTWVVNYIWNNLSTHIGLTFKITSLKKKEKK